VLTGVALSLKDAETRIRNVPNKAIKDIYEQEGVAQIWKISEQYVEYGSRLNDFTSQITAYEQQASKALKRLQSGEFKQDRDQFLDQLAKDALTGYRLDKELKRHLPKDLQGNLRKIEEAGGNAVALYYQASAILWRPSRPKRSRRHV
jgi:NurA-like 5'-3' nuclease